MNFWALVPDFLLAIEGILYLPLLILPCYAICLFIFFRLRKAGEHQNNLITRRQEALPFSCFLMLSLIATTTMLLTLGPRIGTVIPPLLLLSNILFPAVFLLLGLLKKCSRSLRLWSVSSLAGLIHAISWSVWLMALARS